MASSVLAGAVRDLNCYVIKIRVITAHLTLSPNITADDDVSARILLKFAEGLAEM